MVRKAGIILATLGALVFILAPAATSAQENVFGGICEDQAAQQSTACQQDGEDPITGPDGIIARVTNIVAAVAGLLAVIIMIWGGFMYITSGGDSGKTASARNAIIYAAVGLVVIVLAQTIIAFILSNI